MAETREMLTGICKGWNSQGGSAHCDKGHLWRWAIGVGDEPPELGSPCPVCAEIKARGEEVLELIINHIGGMAIGPALKDATIQGIRQAYYEKYGGKW